MATKERPIGIRASRRESDSATAVMDLPPVLDAAQLDGTQEPYRALESLAEQHLEMPTEQPLPAPVQRPIGANSAQSLAMTEPEGYYRPPSARYFDEAAPEKIMPPPRRMVAQKPADSELFDFPVHASIEDWITPKENVLWWVACLVSIPLNVCITGYGLFRYMIQPEETMFVLFVASILLVAYFLLPQGFALGHLQGNGVRVTQQQFPDIFQTAKKMAAKMGLSKMPAIYIMESGGVLNAFAMRLVRKNIVVLNSDVVELAYEEGLPALEFILAHELAHVRRQHTNFKWLTGSALMLIPYLGPAYYRACEFTCDRIAAHCAPEGALAGLKILALGKKLYQKLNLEAYIHTAKRERNFWTDMAEWQSKHPSLSNRFQQLIKLSIIQQAYRRSAS